jgi:transcriptional regulator with XRE-family HTH domain
MDNPLGKRIKQRLVERGLNQKELAEAVGISQPQISRLINGERGTDLEIIKNIAYTLGESPIEYVLLYANLNVERKHEARILRVEQYLEGMNEQEQEMAERMIESIRPTKTRKSSNKQGT